MRVVDVAPPLRALGRALTSARLVGSLLPFLAVGSGSAASAQGLPRAPAALERFQPPAGAGPTGPVQELRRNRPPSLRVDLVGEPRVIPGDELRFEIEVDDPDGHAVSLTLLNPPPGLVLDPVRDEPAPVVRTVRWTVLEPSGGLQRLIFEAHDALNPERRVRLTVPVRVEGGGRSSTVLGDVSGDGVLDVVSIASEADVLGVIDAGALYVWFGGDVSAGPPDASLIVPGGSAFDTLGESTLTVSQPLQLADVSGDGVLDVVLRTPTFDVGGVSDAGAIHLWRGGPTLLASVAPDATLSLPDPQTDDRLGDAAGLGLQLADVNGDGVCDVLAAARFADLGGVVDAGVVALWGGGPDLLGSPLPKALLSIPTPSFADRLGDAEGQALLVGDLTDDGVLDVVVAASGADVGAALDAGAVYVWAGGPALTGSPAPTATLSGGAGGAALGSASGRGVQLQDVTGDGLLDVVAGAPLEDAGGTSSSGAVFVWAGSASLAGSPAPTAALSVPGAAVDDRLGQGGGLGIEAVDVTGDDVLDLVVLAPSADVGGVSDAGAAYLWNGGVALTGTLAPTATFTVAGAAASDRLGQCGGRGLVARDVSGDGLADLILGAELADDGATLDTGALYLWLGGALSGTPAPDATLRVAAAATGDRLGAAVAGRGFQVAELTGDGIEDLVVSAQFADVAGVTNVGALYVWHGRGSWGAAPAADAELTVPGAILLDQLGRADLQGVQVADVTGDDQADLVVGAVFADSAGVANAGVIYVWGGGGALTGALAPDATLSVPGGSTFDSVGASSGQGIQLVDVTGDGLLDVVAGTTSVDARGGLFNAGAVYVWFGAVGMAGARAPEASLEVPGASPLDFLGTTLGQGVQLADVTGDGRTDVVAGARQADIAGVTDTGSIYLWIGPLSVPVGPSATWFVPGATSGDRLGG